jgi:hypothetical protein
VLDYSGRRSLACFALCEVFRRACVLACVAHALGACNAVQQNKPLARLASRPPSEGMRESILSQISSLFFLFFLRSFFRPLWFFLGVCVFFFLRFFSFLSPFPTVVSE